MPHRLTSLSRLAAVLGLLTLVALCAAPASGAATPSWGEIGHFANNSGELTNSEPAFGINPEDGTAWVVDTVEVGTEGEEQFRLQKFEKSGGTWKVVASVDFGQVETESSGVKREVEGVAFDKEKKRAYVLVTEEAVTRPNEGNQVASELWAFSTSTTEGKISPAPETKEGVLVASTEEPYATPVGQKAFSPNDTVKQSALALPGGITVNPSTHQILITGTDAKEQPALWAVSSTGTIEKAWEQSEKYPLEENFEECGCLNSPVVTSGGKILALGEQWQEVYEIPAGLKSTESAKRAYWAPTSKSECEQLAAEAKKGKDVETCPYVEKLNILNPAPEQGGEMSVGPEGNVLIHLKITNDAHQESTFGGVLVLSPTLQEVGWTGGGSSATASQACSVNESGEDGGGPAFIGGSLLTGKAGEGEGIFMFERGQRNTDDATKVLELGAGGSTSECPVAQATTPTASSKGVVLTSFPISATVAFSSTMTQANALSTEWEFEPGVTQTTGRQQETTLVEHKFATEGKHRIKETIHTDDLATPEVKKEVEITITGAPKIENEKATKEGSTTVFALFGEVNPNGQETTCEFEYGLASEAFGGAGIKKKACLESPIEGTEPVKEEVKTETLTAGKEYHFRIVAKAGTSTIDGEEKRFTTGGTAAKPSVETLAVSGALQAEATLKAKVNPNGESTTCEFEYGTTLPGTKVACPTAPGSGTSNVEEAITVKGLTPGTGYHFNVVAKSNAGTTTGTEQSFTTLPKAEPEATTEGASAVAKTTATLTGKADPKGGGAITKCTFDYGTSTSYGKEAACASLPGNVNEAVAVSAAVSGLTAGTTYDYKLVVENATGKGEGANRELTTQAAVKPSVETLAVSGALQTEATLKAKVNPNGESTTCEFEYGTTLPGTKVACPTAPGSGTSNVEEAITVKGLTPGTAYHFNVVAKSNAGTETGAEKSFTTLAKALPEATTEGASAVGVTTATVTGKVNPKGGGAITKCTFEYGPTTSYGKEAACASLPGNVNEAVSVSAALSGLSAGTTYHYKLVVENTTGKGAGADGGLTTQAETVVCTSNCGGGGGG
ncbi:MAG: hypothetical protein ACLQBB_12350, partial [Solirubrobacteraceae bacterium]